LWIVVLLLTVDSYLVNSDNIHSASQVTTHGMMVV